MADRPATTKTVMEQMNTLCTAKNIVVAGLGKSGTAAAQFLKKQGYGVTATDIDDSKRSMAPALEAMGINTEIGFHNISTFENAGLIVVSPGIPLSGEHFQRAVENGVPIRGELDLACQYIKEPIIAITGTNGKTTVTTLISDMLKASGKKVFTGGNIGTPLISYLDQGEKADVVVAEVSSFQLDTAVDFAPDVAVLLNITQDHLDRYPDFKAYQDSKWSIFAHQKKHGYAVVNGAMEMEECNIKGLTPQLCLFNTHTMGNSTLSNTLMNHTGDTKDHSKPFFPVCTKWSVAEQDYIRICSRDSSFINQSSSFINQGSSFINQGSSFINQGSSCINQGSSCINQDSPFTNIDISQTPLKGKHNRENMEAAALAALCAGGTVKGVEQALKQFQGLSHRTEYVATINKVSFYNDSKATNTDAVARAIESFGRRIILIMGGQEKSTDFSTLKPWITDRVKTIVAMGESREKIFDCLCDAGAVTITADSMEQAVRLAFDKAEPEDTVLLSPACASFDMYQSYAHRGEDFIKQVHRLK